MKKLCSYSLIKSYSSKSKHHAVAVSFIRIKTLGKLGKLLTCYFGLAKLDSVPNYCMLKFFGLPNSSVVIPSVPKYPVLPY